MAITADIIAWGIWKGLKGKISDSWVVFLAASLADIDLCGHFDPACPGLSRSRGRFVASFLKFAGIFAT